MKKLSLNGVWKFKQADGENYAEGIVPGCNYLDLLRNGVIPDPRTGINENLVQWVGEKNWQYKRIFNLTEDDLNADFIELAFEMLDTLSDIYVNGQKVGSGNNINRTYVFNIRDYVKAGENEVKVDFYQPHTYIAKLHIENPLPNSTMGETGSSQIRKSPYHFGWDWGPHFLTQGISRDAYINIYSVAKLSDIKIKQEHNADNVILKFSLENTENANGLSYEISVLFDGEKIASVKTNENNADLKIENPKLWWCNGLGEQPLYDVCVKLLYNGNEIDEKAYKIGLRKLELDNHLDKYGRNFCFYLNDVRVFARGANWIASDSFVNDTSVEKLDDLLEKAKICNMNMLRVWGGAYYESDLFYDMCDKKGLLVWQDFNFACQPYPFNNKEFLDNIKLEIEDNVKRLRHHASLCLWAGNNEIESMSMAWFYKKNVIKFTGEFFYKTLASWLKEFDDVTPYWATTPSSGEYMKKINGDDFGDTHLWHVWHGLRPLEYYRKRNTRFCSEFGIESFPSLNALDIYANGEKLETLGDPVMEAHQKCVGGNTKMLFYVLSKYWTPHNFLDLVYLTGLTQAQCVQNATEGWRIKKERCNGSLYWQYNDCWGVCSWSGMDYYGNMKAVQYAARHFNSPLTAAIQNFKNKSELYLINDSRDDALCRIEYGIKKFNGETRFVREKEIYIKSISSVLIDTLSYAGLPKPHCYQYVKVYKNNELISERYLPLTAENKSVFLNPNLSYEFKQENGLLLINLKAENYARYVEIRVKGENGILSDNYFDMDALSEKQITLKLSRNFTDSELKDAINVRSLYDIKCANSRIKDKFIKAKIFFKPINLINYIIRTFDF